LVAQQNSKVVRKPTGRFVARPMNDPHVTCLRYRLLPSPRVSYRAPPPLSFDHELFSGVLEGGLLTLTPKHHYPSIIAARDTADRFIRGWEVHTTLQGMPGAIEFEYDSGDVVDRDPPAPGESAVLQVHGMSQGQSLDHVTLQVIRDEYPAPPEHFRLTSDVEVLWNRLESYRAGREPLLSMGYFCLTWIERQMTSGRSAAANLLNTEQTVLKKLGELTSTRGDPATARKIGGPGPLKELSEAEAQWIIAALEALVRNAGEASNCFPPRVRMSDLPTI